MRLFRLFALLACVSGACSQFSGTSSTPDDDAGTGDSGIEASADGGCGDLTSDPKNCGMCGHACAATEFCAKSACAPGCAGGIIYVSNGGNDTNDGCSLQTSKQTIGAAINYARVIGAVNHSIHACRGTYQEGPLTLAYPISLMGGFDCASGLRPPDYGYPTFNPSSLTVLTSPAANDPQSVANTLIVNLPLSDSGPPPAITIDGIKVTGPSGAALNGIAVYVNGAAGLTISNDWISGGATTATLSNVGSVGLEFASLTLPEVSHTKIEGGAGSTPLGNGYGSVAVYAGAGTGPINIHDSTIAGGSGQSAGLGSVGVLRGNVVASTATSRLLNNVIDGGTGHAATDTFASVGVNIYGAADFQIIGNTITGGVGSCAVDCNVGAILAGTAGAHLTIRNNRIYGGDAQVPIGSAGAVYGLYLQGAASLDLSQNIIHPGNQIATSPQVTSAIAVQLIAPTMNATLDQNTIRIFSPGGAVPAYGVSVVQGALHVVTTNNLFLGGSGGSMETVFYTDQCQGGFGSVQSNAIVSVDRVLLAPQFTSPGVCSGFAALTDLTTTLSRLGQEAPSPAVNSNLMVSAACSPADTTAGSCIGPTGCTTPAACLGLVETSALSEMDFVQGSGAKLAADAPCRITTGGANLLGLFPTDFFGVARTVPLSIGAAESDATTCTP